MLTTRVAATSCVLAVAGAVALFASTATAAQWSPGGPMRIVLLVDSSSTTATMVKEFRASLDAFLEALPGDPEIVIVSTGGQLRVRVPPTSDRPKLRAAAIGFSPDGGANSFLETMLEADARFLKKAPNHRSVLVMLTSDAGTTVGEARIDAYNAFANDFIARGGRAHALVVGGINRGITTRIAEHLVNNTGGFYESVLLASALPKMMRTLADYVAADL